MDFAPNTIAQGARLETHAAVRLQPTDNDRWELRNLATHECLIVSRALAALLIAFIGGNSVEDAVRAVAARKLAQEEDAIVTTQMLLDAGLLIRESEINEQHRWASAVMSSWSRYGWSEAADYFLATYDYPFLSYSEPEGIFADAHRMREYRSAEPDLLRAKPRSATSGLIAGPNAADALATATTSFWGAWEQYSGHSPAARPPHLNIDKLMWICGIVFGILRQRDSTDPALFAPLMRKTSPSGGSRHPTEAYVVALDVDGLEEGLYHYAVEEHCLDRIGPLPAKHLMPRLFDGLYRSRQERAIEPACFVLLTSVFERNMYRYREPRTFRTVFLDVGHLIATLDFVCASVGYACYAQHGIADGPVEELLLLDGLVEGLLYGAAIGS